jgi:hypothetical protein
MRDLKSMPTPQIMSYVEATLQVINILENCGRQAVLCVEAEGMDEVRMNQIHGALEEKLAPVRKAYGKVTEEMDRRLKHDLGIVGFDNADKFVQNIVKDNPYMLCGKDEIALLKAEKIEADKKSELEANKQGEKSKPVKKLNPKK